MKLLRKVKFVFEVSLKFEPKQVFRALRSSRFGLLSLFIHLLFLVFFVTSQLAPDQSVQKELPSSGLEFEVHTSSGAEQLPFRPSAQVSNQKIKRPQGASRSNRILENLSPKYNPGEGFSEADFEDSKNFIGSQETYDSYHSENGAMGKMLSMGLGEEMKMLPYLNGLWGKIDRDLEYPDAILKQRITGHVSIHLELDERGVFSGDLLDVRGSDLMLKTYVLAYLLQQLKKPLSQRLWLKKRQKFPLMLSFEFSTYSSRFERIDEREPNHKNALAFRRHSYIRPILNQKWDEYVARNIPPTIPIPGGFYIDFVMAYKMIEQIGMPSSGEVRERRLENLRRQLELSIRGEEQTS